MQLSAQGGRAALALGAVAALLAACSASVNGFSDSGGGFASASGPTGGGVGAPNAGSASECLKTQVPKSGDGCFTVEVCEYGGSADPACNVVARCDGSSWTVDQPSHCPTSCPAKFDARKPGEACGGPDVCTYLEATCGCAGAIAGAWVDVYTGGDGGSTPVPTEAGTVDSDGGDGDGGEGGVPPAGAWQCVRPGAGCPARKPVMGAHCTTEGLSCDYGTCIFGVPLTTMCTSSAWTAATTGQVCP